MYRLTSANHLRTLFTASAAPYPRRLLRLNPPLRSFASTYSSRRCVADPPPPPATDDFVNVGVKGKIRGEDSETLPGNAYKRKVLPPELLSENVAMLTCESSAAGGICDVYLVGTLHDSPESRREVTDVIQFLKPEVVFLEMCPSHFTVTQEAVDGSTVKLAGTQHEKPDGYIREMTFRSGAESRVC